MSLSVVEIIKEHIVENGYDGLYNLNGSCACRLDELVCCEEIGMECRPGYFVPCDDDEFTYCIGEKGGKCESE